MKLGAWIHDHSDRALRTQVGHAAEAGIRTLRGYTPEYCAKVAPWAKERGLSLMAGIPVSSKDLVRDWKSQVRLDVLERVARLPCKIEAICVGNELREGGDAWERKRFTARLSFGLARVIETYRAWLIDRGLPFRLTYAMEGIVFDDARRFKEHLWPLVEACDVVSLNLYPMSAAHWRDFAAFEVNRAFLEDRKAWRRAISDYESMLRRTMDVLALADKALFLSEMGFPSGVGYRVQGRIGENEHIRPKHDAAAFSARMQEYVRLLAEVSADYDKRLETAYFYEWWDNHYHRKIWNVEKSPIHTCFGLCDETGTEKVDVAELVRIATD